MEVLHHHSDVAARRFKRKSWCRPRTGPAIEPSLEERLCIAGCCREALLSSQTRLNRLRLQFIITSIARPCNHQQRGGKIVEDWAPFLSPYIHFFSLSFFSPFFSHPGAGSRGREEVEVDGKVWRGWVGREGRLPSTLYHIITVSNHSSVRFFEKIDLAWRLPSIYLR